MIGKKNIDILPYMVNSELDVDNHEDATKKIMKGLGGGDILFAHHCISGTTFNGMKTDILKEVVLPKEKLEKKYKLIVAGHIHSPSQYDNVLITGNVFTSEVGEIERFIYKIKNDLSIEKILLPGRQIHKLNWAEDSDKVFGGLPKNSIVKCIVDVKGTDIDLVKETLKRFDASLIIENYPNERKKVVIKEGAFDFSVEGLLKLYSEEKKVSYEQLLEGLQLIK